MDWNDVRHFLALARTGSVRAAGQALDVSHSTVARRVEALEERLATRLFDRSRDGYTLTEAGERMLPSAERVELEMAAMERGLVGADERLAGSVSVTVCDGWVSAILVRALGEFCDRNPEIELTITSDTRSYDLTRREADVAVRILAVGQSPPEHLVARKLVPMVLASYVAVAHADRLDPDRPGSSPRWLSSDDFAVHRWLVEGSSYPDVPLWGAFCSLELMMQGCREGLGLAFLPTYIGDAEPGLRRLARPDPRHVADLWLLSHPDLRRNARFRATREHVAAAMEAHLPLFRGACPADGTSGPEIEPEEVRHPSVQ